MSINEESSYKILANNIYKFRVLNNLSQKELAEKSKLSAAYISQIENCRPNKGIASIVKIAQALKVRRAYSLRRNLVRNICSVLNKPFH